MPGHWRRLLNLIDHLPRNSYYVEAMADDEELAEMALSAPERLDVPTGPRVSQWSLEAEIIAAAVDRLGEMFAVTIVSNGGKPPRLTPYPRPVTATERVRSRLRRERHASLVSRVLRG